MEMHMLLPLVTTTVLLSIPAWQPLAAAPACQRRCGGVDIPYPFGIGRGCFLDTGDRTFEVTCRKATASDDARPFADGFEVLGIDPGRGKIRIRSPVSSWCYDGARRSMGAPDTWSFNSTALRVSDADNKLAVVGCSALAYIGSQDGAVENRYVVGCHAECASAASLSDGPCNGTGCCLTPVPPGISSFDVAFDDAYNNSAVAGFSPCSYAVLVEAAAFEFRATYVTTGALGDAGGVQVPAVLDWAVGNQTCRDVRRKKTGAYACASANSECVDAKNGPGYLCNCSKGYQGNPYVIHGCQDINECEEKASYPCAIRDSCINTIGGYKCPCPAQKRGYSDGTCEADRSITKLQIAIGFSIGVVMLALGMTCTYAIQEKRRVAVVKTRHFRQHGGQLLFEEMKKSNKQGMSFTLFTKQELQEATGNFDERHVLGKGGNGTVYRGTLQDGTAVAIKRCRIAGEDERQQREFGMETLILAQINHKNIVKLYGCCLEVEVPMLVYQFIPNGTLYQLLHGGAAVVPFAVRLRIAHETAEALAYLHSMASPPIIHGDVKSPNILLDENYGAKVSDFGASSLAPAPTDEAHLVTFVQGTCGYLDPEYMQTCRLTEKSDVYSFGVVLLELLTSRKALNLAAPDDEKSVVASFLTAARDGRLDGLLDARIKSEVGAETLERVAKLAKLCLEMSGERRPSMREVAEELDGIRKASSQNPCLLGEGEEALSDYSVVDMCDW
ncbi:unnamed protein product [Triticum turgidum subsp. durum]|uniref:Protein kinase domain-containing protein n=1 Tax=Triticum turgidum subsp. durum TaxID=4567 RepID=A0A9R0TIP2_TRITD|nr:unnamed protein product [Triticum turgidum subsp. durum]